MDAEVLVVGAGPTGLVLALWLAHQGIRVRIVDKSGEPGTTSRAVVVQARTLEFYRQLGLADEVVRAGLELGNVNLWARGKQVAHVDLRRLGEGVSPYPFGLIYPQDEHERLLIEKLSGFGVHVERNTELEACELRGERVIAKLSGKTSEALFVAGCDGARSTLRGLLDLGFEGGTYEHLFYVADVDARGPLMNRELHVSIDASDFVALFPLAASGRARLIGPLPAQTSEEAERRGWDGVSTELLTRLNVGIERVNWFSTYRVHHRVASRFRAGRAFLLGDAAHVHSPVGGQGMNTGIGDAVNLAWKLAAVVRGRAPAALLDSYEPERIGFARRLVATTDRVFQFISRSGALAERVRVGVFPPVIGAAARSSVVRRFLFRTASQTAISYRKSPLSSGHAGRVHAGDRLPWVRTERDNFEPLASLGWQVHVYGEATRELTQACKRRGFACHVFRWSDEAAAAGFARDAVYLLRPDGHVAFAEPSPEADALLGYLDQHALRSSERVTYTGDRFDRS